MRKNSYIDRCFVALSDFLGSNTAISIFFVIAFVPLMVQLPRSVLEWQIWLSQTAIQLIALGIIQKGTHLEGQRNYKILKETHYSVMAELRILKDHIKPVKGDFVL